MKTGTWNRMWRTVCAGLTLCVFAATARAALINVGGGTGAVVFGVTPIGGAANPAPVFIPNNVTGLTDILSSPGNGWLTAAPTIPNNIQEFFGPLPIGSFRVGGGNVNGPFGAGAAVIDANGNVGFTLRDTAPAGGSGSYVVASSITQFASVGNTVGTVGAALAISGRLLTAASSMAVSLTVHISDTAGVFNGIVSPPMILAVGGGFNDVATGDFWATQFNPFTGQFAGLAFDTTPLLNIPDGDLLTVRTTLTAIADPAELAMITPDDPLFSDLLAQSGGALADTMLSAPLAGPVVPAPGSALALALAVGGASLRRRRAA